MPTSKDSRTSSPKHKPKTLVLTDKEIRWIKRWNSEIGACTLTDFVSGDFADTLSEFNDSEKLSFFDKLSQLGMI